MRLFTNLFIITIVSLISSQAFAEDNYTAPQTDQDYHNIAATPVPVSNTTNSQNVVSNSFHRGFQFRAAGGFGNLNDNEPSTNSSVSGFAGSAELYFGGYVVPMFALGVVASDVNALNPSASQNGQPVSVADGLRVNLFTMGPYFDIYFGEYSGWHLLGSVGAADLNMSFNGNTGATAYGFAVSGGLGYDWRVSREWSVGFLGKINYASMQFKSTSGVFNNEIDYTENTLAPTVLLSISYH